MIAAMVAAILIIVLALIAVWLASPAFRTWSEQPKYGMLERNAQFERSVGKKPLAPINIEKPDG